MNAQGATNPNEWTLGRLLSWTTEYLAGHEVDEPRLSAEVLLAHAVGCQRIHLYTRFEETLDEPALVRFRELIKRAAAHEPIAYLVGEKEFFSLPFTVTPDVLIPRPETETLVEYVIDYCRSCGKEDPWLLDLGTGSGCIAIAVLSQLGQARAVATDVSQPALAVAEENAMRHGVTDRLRLVCADRLNLPSDVRPHGGFDVVMSNPPYVSEDELADLDANVREFEPEVALTDGQDGLSLQRAMSADAGRVLKPEGIVVLEIAAGQGPAVRDLFESAGWSHHATCKDRVERHDRVMVFKRAK
jgi:release factor glutamine methyltransferase